MTSFAFTAVHADGRRERGTVVAADSAVATALIRSRGCLPLEIRPAGRMLHGGRMDAAEIAVGLRMLSVLLRGGLPLARAMQVLQTAASPRWQAALPSMLDRIRQGSCLAEVLRTSVAGLPPYAVGIVEAGERGSGLAEAVTSAAAVLEARTAQQSALRSVLAYPAVLAAAGSATMIFLVVVVLPRFALLLGETGQQLPPTTALLLAAGAAVERWGVTAAIGTVAAAGAGALWLRAPEHQLLVHAALNRLPVAGPVRMASATGRVCSALGALLQNGVPLVHALLSAAGAAGNPAIHAAIHRARGRVARGDSLSAALRDEYAVTPAAIALLHVGEQTGELASLAQQAGLLESELAIEHTKRFVRLLEPACVLLFGGLVLFAAAAMLQAMYGLRPL
jgi:general secretion pathway protein F